MAITKLNDWILANEYLRKIKEDYEMAYDAIEKAQDDINVSNEVWEFLYNEFYNLYERK